MLYKNKDGFEIAERLGEVKYYAEIFKSAVMTYGLSISLNYDELIRITKKIYDYIRINDFEAALGSPWGPKDIYLRAILSITSSILSMDKNKLKTEESGNKFFDSILQKLIDIERTYTWDTMTRY